MKELSIDEKAKAYDEAIERYNAKQEYESQKVHEFIEYLFPELKKSEDEKIRKDVIKAFKVFEEKQTWVGHCLDFIDWNKCYSWLEKQGEPKPNPVLDIEIPFGAKDSELQEASYYIPEGFHAEIESNRVVIKRGEQKPAEDEELTEFDKAVSVSIGTWNPKTPEQIKSVKAVSKKLLKLAKKQINDEQKPAEWSEEDEEIFEKALSMIEWYSGKYESDSRTVSDWLKSLKIEVCFNQKQKPAWSEEDEMNLDWLITVCERIHYKSNPQVSPKGALILRDWLKSLKERVQSQPKQEWSEEDKDMWEAIEACCKLNRPLQPEHFNWLKSLRPQKQQEWNKQDIEMIDWLIRCCEKEHEELCNDRYGHQEIVSDLKRDCRKKWDWLESLKNKVVPQNTWKPSDEQMEALEVAIEHCDKAHFVNTNPLLVALYKDLWNLK